MSNVDVPGPIDFIIVEFPSGSTGAGTADALSQLLDAGLIRLYDLLLVAKNGDGSVDEIDPSGDDAPLSAWQRFAGARSGLLDSADVNDAAGALAPDSLAAVVLFENSWAAPFVGAAMGEGAQAVASARLTAQEIIDALDAAEAAS